MKRVVITGLGTVNPLGNNVKDTWAAVQASKNGIARLENLDIDTLKVKIGAQVKNFDPTQHELTPAEAKRFDKYTVFGLAAANEAFKDAGLVEGSYTPERFGAIIGAGIGGLDTLQENIYRAKERGPSRVTPMFIPKCIANACSGNVAIKLNAKGHNVAIATACAAGTQSIGEAFEKIKYGKLDLAVTGGAEASANEVGISGFAALTALNFTEDVNNASIPFSKDRAGFVIGEGAGILILEELEHAKKRGAKIYAEVVGYGSTCDAYHITAPDGIGSRRAMAMAIEDAGLKTTDVDYINAHGTSTPFNDKFEAKAITDLFQDHTKDLLVSSSKSQLGHCLGASGGIEAVISVLALKDGVVPPTINLREQDPEIKLNCVPNKAIKKDIKVAMSNSFGFGGHNGVLLFKKWEN